MGIHRDFYPDQVLVGGEHLYLLDFDLYCEGDPALDIGNFVGHMREYGLRTTGSPDAFKEHEQAMVERFVQLSSEATRQRIEVYSLLTLARHVYLSTQFPERQSHTESLLGLCEEELDILLRTPAGV
jgi:thiamine kinase-like enzyme